jgi:hypothetical protein
MLYLRQIRPVRRKGLSLLGSLFAGLCIFLILNGCSDKKSGATQYPAPEHVGTGTVLIFEAKNSWGTKIFHESLSEYFQQHKDQRLLQIKEIDHDGNNDPKKYLVLVEYLNGAVPPPNPPPTTMPAVNQDGEINYP